MENKNFIPDSIQAADLDKSWHIPRPTLARSSQSSQGSTSSNNSTQSVRSGSLLLTAANLAQIHQLEQPPDVENEPPLTSTRDQNIRYYLQTQSVDGVDHLPPSINVDKKEPDSVSIASSTHFTVVNMNTRHRPPQRSFCRKHQLTILVLTMSVVFTIGIMAAILLLELRAQNQRY
ncbi:uncharacterized protein LOC130890839 [Diorhabda carinulata]|uniref:uncharacterized protein LOC130890839 n=1 Tax=Diorhabda carinulata TaxID=1163345 RepID=UPI0025A26C29|nr:uncharacterized protein LOC130890839 [Diorhabda carinulata]